MKIKVNLIAYRTVTIELEVDDENNIDEFKLKEKAIDKARSLGVVPTWEIEDWEPLTTEVVEKQ